MEPFITKVQASCMVLGEAVTESNRLKCKAIIEETPFQVVYTIAEGKMRPVAVGKQVVERNPFTYQKYPVTPPSSPTLSSIDIDEAELTGRLPEIKRI
ncbi:hypothetical protein G6F46_013884 [Rhizopus delemar]|uniref:Uncharacterized protein n=1 Tax=Rhizopus oryzae TaxID=64495 RepID=A0A9P7C053_RHIOR|nr:hypothetical protein G6F55_013624 [Rhizopus delemar]KAG1530223.1 hypothetical protein G6F51_013904 [Rhizopus arrhizus]KAG1483310.1 hypothetical protein G6F54_013559 [Rhizopus delemar]KAG1488304.1 hypothetical protein G6F53_013605 [Rhizopus delemar]KAG1491028.1 hypothetical protein G6F52_013527 [Rhizopus delemar]